MDISSAREHIEEIRSHCEVSGGEWLRRLLEGAVQSVEKGFSREGHYLFEFIQNAEDAGAEHFECIVEGQTLTVRNSGDAFAKMSVEALCDIGHSSKSPENYIGFLGVGFKSVFIISDDVEIHSDPYHFAFRRDETRPDFPWQVVPLWCEPIEITAPWHTEFLIKIRDEELTTKIGQEMGRESLNPRVLLFLKCLRQVNLDDRNTGHRRVIEKTETSSNNSICVLQETSADGISTERWTVFHSGQIEVPEDIHNNWFTGQWDRDKVKHRAVNIAFKLTEEGELDFVQGSLHMGVFSYLPVREERSRLKFLVHADFLTSAGRTRIQDEAPWNIWLAKEVLKLIKKESLTLLKDAQWRRNALPVLWPQQSDSDDFFATYVEQQLKQYLLAEVKLPAYDGTYITPPEGILVSDPDLWELVGPEEMEHLYARKLLMQGVYVPSTYPEAEIVKRAPSFLGNSKNSGFVSSSEGKEFLIGKASGCEIAFFKLLYRKMDALWTSPATYRNSPLSWSAIVLTSDLKLATPSEQVFFKPLQLIPGIEQHFKFVHPELASDETSKKFLESMGIQILPDSKIRQVVAESLVPDIRSKWSLLSNDECRHWLANFKGMLEKGDIQKYALEFVTVPTKSNKWLPPKTVLFPQEYSPEHQLEMLVRQGYLDDPSIEFVENNLANGVATETWKDFLLELGVGEPTKDQTRMNRWSSRVGIQIARRYEKKHGRQVVHEVTESERGVSDPGYDLHSKRSDDTDARYIEVKATKGSGNFTLRPTTLQQILVGANKANFFIYVITQALSSPRLHVIKADKLTQEVLLKVGDIQLEVQKIPVAETVNLDMLPP